MSPRGEGTLIFTYIRRLGSFFRVKNLEFQYLFGFSEKMNIFWGMKILWIFFFSLGGGGGGGHQKIGLYLGDISMQFRVFFKVNVQNGGYFWGLLKFQIFLGCLKFLIFFGG